MLTWASLGAARGRPAPRAVEAPLQTVKKAQVSSRGGERPAGRREGSIGQEGGEKAPPCPAHPEDGMAGPAWPGAAPQEPPCGWKLLPQQNFGASSPWVPWAALHAEKLLAIPILNTSTMVYGPWRDNYGVQNPAFMAPAPQGALREQYVSCSQFR